MARGSCARPEEESKSELLRRGHALSSSCQDVLGARLAGFKWPCARAPGEGPVFHHRASLASRLLTQSFPVRAKVPTNQRSLSCPPFRQVPPLRPRPQTSSEVLSQWSLMRRRGLPKCQFSGSKGDVTSLPSQPLVSRCQLFSLAHV